MKKRIVKKRAITLIEMIIAMFLIALIIGVVGYNYQGALEKGKIFKTKVGIQKLENALDLATAEDPRLLENLESNWQEIIRQSLLVKDADALIRDGWGQEYNVTVQDEKVVVRSDRYEEYKREHPQEN